METSKLYNMNIVFNYREESNQISLDDDDLCHAIVSAIQPMTDDKQWFPNDEIDNRIRKYVADKIKNESFYKTGLHPYYMVVQLNEKPYHVVFDYYSDADKERIINDIMNQTD